MGGDTAVLDKSFFARQFDHCIHFKVHLILISHPPLRYAPRMCGDSLELPGKGWHSYTRSAGSGKDNIGNGSLWNGTTRAIFCCSSSFSLSLLLLLLPRVFTSSSRWIRGGAILSARDWFFAIFPSFEIVFREVLSAMETACFLRPVPPPPVFLCVCLCTYPDRRFSEEGAFSTGKALAACSLSGFDVK